MKLARLLIAATAAVVALAPVAAQADYPNDPPIVNFGSGSTTPGGTLTISTQNFCPNALVTFRIGGTTVGTATTSATGVATLVTTAPATAGTYVVTAQVTTPCALTATGNLTVVAQTTTTIGGGLPQTGSEPINWVRSGGIAVLVGLGLIGAARLRRRPQAA